MISQILLSVGFAAPTCDYAVTCRCYDAPTFDFRRRAPAYPNQTNINTWYTEEITDVELALHAWDEVPGASMPLSLHPKVWKEPDPYAWANAPDGVNSIVRWSNGHWPFPQAPQALMVRRRFATGCTVHEADIHIRDQYTSMEEGPDDVDTYQTQNQGPPPAGGYQERSPIAHEFGHALGFGHSTAEPFPEIMSETGDYLDIDHLFGPVFPSVSGDPDHTDLHIGPLEGHIVAQLYPDAQDNPQDVALIPWRVLDEAALLLAVQNEVWTDAFSAAESTEWTHDPGTHIDTKTSSQVSSDTGYGPSTIWVSNRGPLLAGIDVVFFIHPFSYGIDCFGAYGLLQSSGEASHYTLLQTGVAGTAWSMQEVGLEGFELPEGAEPGEYRLCAIADPENLIYEEVTWNNQVQSEALFIVQ